MFIAQNVTENEKLQWPRNFIYYNKHAIYSRISLNLDDEQSTVLFGENESTGKNHNLGKNLSNQFGSTLSLTHLAKQQWDKSISPKGTRIEQKVF